MSIAYPDSLICQLHKKIIMRYRFLFCMVSSQLPNTIEEAPEQEPMVIMSSCDEIGEEQLKDKELRPVIIFSI